MKEFTKQPEKFILKIHAHPAKNGFKIKGFSEWNNALELEIKETPVKGKANAEIEKKLSEFFQAKCRIISGFKNKNKTIIVETPKEKIQEKLEKLH